MSTILLFRSDDTVQEAPFLRAQRKVIVLYKTHTHTRSPEAVLSRTSSQVNNIHTNFRVIK